MSQVRGWWDYYEAGQLIASIKINIQFSSGFISLTPAAETPLHIDVRNDNYKVNLCIWITKYSLNTGTESSNTII